MIRATGLRLLGRGCLEFMVSERGWDTPQRGKMGIKIGHDNFAVGVTRRLAHWYSEAGLGIAYEL